MLLRTLFNEIQRKIAPQMDKNKMIKTKQEKKVLPNCSLRFQLKNRKRLQTRLPNLRFGLECVLENQKVRY